MVNSKIRVGVVGLGYLGKFHFEKYRSNKSVNLTSIVDIDRKNLDLTCSDELCKFWGKVDEQIKDQLEKNSEHYFKKKLTRTQIDSMYKPTVLGREGYPPQFRTKIPVVDDKVSCYDFDRNPVQLDRHVFKKASVVPIVHLKHVYFSGEIIKGRHHS